MNLFSYQINIMMPLPATGFTIDATPIIIIGALIVLGYAVLTIKRSMNNETTVNDTLSTPNEDLDTTTSIKQDTVKINTNTQNDSSEDNLEEELYENYEDTEKVFTLNRR